MHSQAHAGCDPRYNFREKGDNTLTTRFRLKTEIAYNMLAEHARAQFCFI